jgi:ribosomal protein S12 methylthiotransferase accessory factor
VRHALLEILERDLLWRAWYAFADLLRVPSTQLLPATLRRTLQELALEATVLVVPGPAQTACVAVCVHTGSGHEQSFGARAAAGRDPLTLGAAAEVAAYEALMVRWSMRSPVAEQAWHTMRARSGPDTPRNMLEHAVLAFHRPEALGFWLDRSVPAPTIPAGPHAAAQLDEHQLARVLAEHTGAEIVAVDTTIAEVAAEGGCVIRVVAAGARQLPNDERAVIPPDPVRQRALPHPFG